MTDKAFLSTPYAREAEATVQDVTEDGRIVLDSTIFYATGGGQPGDSGWLSWEDQEIAITDTVKGENGDVVLVPESGEVLPVHGQKVHQRLDWERRYSHMRVHTALHLLSVVIPLPVTGGSIAVGKGRLDFAMPEPPEDRQGLEDHLNELIARDLAVTQDWISEDDLDANPGLVKTMSVQPPRGAGRVRLIRIGAGETQIDLQPCGGTHVARTGEIGTVRLGKIENKGKQNRRVNLLLDG
ncbi:alanyl-tRNA editing protein [Pseudoruegeria sp. HB172150]|uniref:alanyl-tRNA editing protein n=1 Tax=Pseudoruegeria sp. HB172150 TaxID=2721164 RepID=UPI0015580B58|nr:alanyl-tRNA editing protein [Pseudoruegeria sp. HB172150]